MMSATPKSHDSQSKMQNGPIMKDDTYVMIKATVKGYTLVPNNATAVSGY